MTLLRTRQLEACPICDSRLATRAFTLPDRLYGVPGEFIYDRCGDCGTVYQNPQVVPEDLPRCYPGAFYTHMASGTAAFGDHAVSKTRRRLRDAIMRTRRGEEARSRCDAVLGRLLGASRLLRERAFYGLLDELTPWRPDAGRAVEIGCGSGQVLELLHRNGWRVEGIEWDAAAAEAARARTGLPVAVGDFLDLELAAGAYDLVLLDHVIEHLPSPQRALQRLAVLLRPGGRLVLTYPNQRGLGARLMGVNWFHWDPPRHLALPPAPALIGAARRHGLRLRSRRTLTRWVDANFAWARERRHGGRLADASANRLDYAFIWLSRRLAHVGLGEQWLLAFEKPDAPSAK